MVIRDKIKKVMKLLDKAYGSPSAFQKDDPVDVLIRTVLSQNTTDKNSLAAFDALKKRFGTWEEVLDAGTRDVALVIRHAGLGNIKAKRIRGALSEIMAGKRIDLGFLEKMGTEEALEYLTSLKGVGPKTAACVLLFSFNKPVMPVDTHIFRVAKRLGLIGGDIGIEEAHKILTNIVPKRLIYRFHLGIIEHGRRTCKSQTPKCGVCVVYGLCGFKKKELYKKRYLK